MLLPTNESAIPITVRIYPATFKTGDVIYNDEINQAVKRWRDTLKARCERCNLVMELYNVIYAKDALAVVCNSCAAATRRAKGSKQEEEPR